MTIAYRSIQPADFEAVRQFLAGLGWDRRVRDPQRFAKMMERADRTVLALDDGRVVGEATCGGDDSAYTVGVRPANFAVPIIHKESP